MADPDMFSPDWASAPGDTIADGLAERNLSKRQFARAIERPVEEVERLLLGETEITPAIAQRLRTIVGGTAAFWLARERQYRWSLAARQRANLEGVDEWLAELPVKDMVELGWIEGARSSADVGSQCLAFFKTPSIAAWRVSNAGLFTGTAFRTSRTLKSTLGAVATWLRRGEVAAEALATAKWDPVAFKEALQAVRPLTRKRDPKLFLPELVRLSAACGVAVVIVRAPAGCRASGATRFISSDKAVLQLSFRFLSDDHFWFTFFHEAGHLLLHPRKSVFLEDGSQSSPQEDEANRFAYELFIPAQFQHEFVRLPVERHAIRHFAQRVGISPGIVLGQLQFFSRARRNQLNILKARFHWSEDMASVSL
jgi:HTH-type transcriptional regulator / antitoxin HigA